MQAEDREKASEARQFTKSTEKSFRAKQFFLPAPADSYNLLTQQTALAAPNASRPERSA
jgi:hypothetical protein